MFWFPPRALCKDPSLIIQVWEAPCHTRGHLLFLLHENPRLPAETPFEDLQRAALRTLAVFTGDTLFAGGTGKFFEGSAAEMAKILMRVSNLPSSVKVFCGHEYTLSNYKFAAALEPDNGLVMERIRNVQQLRRDRLPTLPSTIGEEIATNPYIRVVISKAACAKIALLLNAANGTRKQEGEPDSITVLSEVRRCRDENVLKDKIEQMFDQAK
mmetsp:Transcript_32621/g.103296  ORF Transcript_32621/g.103296 Transcript_32621/m.103296 type:complete len:213 (-) Transcript_32621:131-769(-)